jgi:hypothetical protein
MCSVHRIQGCTFPGKRIRASNSQKQQNTHKSTGYAQVLLRRISLVRASGLSSSLRLCVYKYGYASFAHRGRRALNYSELRYNIN